MLSTDNWKDLSKILFYVRDRVDVVLIYLGTPGRPVKNIFFGLSAKKKKNLKKTYVKIKFAAFATSALNINATVLVAEDAPVFEWQGSYTCEEIKNNLPVDMKIPFFECPISSM